MSDTRGKAARPHAELLAEIMDSRIPKTEREHAAAREIERLTRELAEARDERDLWRQGEAMQKVSLDELRAERDAWKAQMHPQDGAACSACGSPFEGSHFSDCKAATGAGEKP